MRAQQRTGRQTATGRGTRYVEAIAALHMDVIARGGRRAGVVLSLRQGEGMGNHCCWCDGHIGW
jgi:hypothetical protein